MNENVQTLVEAAKMALIYCEPKSEQERDVLSKLKQAIWPFEKKTTVTAGPVEPDGRIYIEVIGLGYDDDKPLGLAFDPDPNETPQQAIASATRKALDMVNSNVALMDQAVDLSNVVVIHGAVAMGSRPGFSDGLSPFESNTLDDGDPLLDVDPGQLWDQAPGEVNYREVGRNETVIEDDTTGVIDHTPVEFPYGARYTARPHLPVNGGHVYQCKGCAHEFEIEPGMIVPPCTMIAFSPNERKDNPQTECGGEHRRIR